MTTHKEPKQRSDRFWHKRSFQKVLILTVGIVLGALVILQARYFTSYVSTYGRDPGENIFREIQILKTTNQELEDTIQELELQLEDASSQAKVLDSIEDEIKKIQKLAGEIDIWGTGIELKVDGDISAIWFVDIVNELFSVGAEAISINDIRITDGASGFDTLPNGQIMLNSVILSKPYTFKAIGEKSVLTKALEFPGGIIERLKNNYSGIDTTLNELDKIEMGVI